MSEQIVRQMRERARQLRRVAELAHDRRIIEELLKMASAVEVDADKLAQEPGTDRQD